jgi:hypothetical protein
MNSASINQEDVITVLEADRYGHPRRARLTRLSMLANHSRGLAPQADRFGHLKEPNLAFSVPAPIGGGAPREGEFAESS